MTKIKAYEKETKIYKILSNISDINFAKIIHQLIKKVQNI